MSASSPQDLESLQDQLQLDNEVAPDDTTEADAEAAEAVQDFNEAFSEAVYRLVRGEWELMFEQIRAGTLEMLGVLLPRLLVAALVFLFLYVIYRVIDRALGQILERSKHVEPGLQNLLLKTYRVVALLFIAVIVLGQLQVDVTAIVAGLSIAGIAFGFAARDSLENFISGVTILIDEPFRVGDYIETNDEYGEVDEITLRSTRIRTRRNEIMVLPNSHMISEPLINHTKRNTVRCDVPFGIAYKEYPQEAREVVLDLCEGDDRILNTPEPTVVVNDLGDSSVDMMLRFYLREPRDEVPMQWEYMEKVREALRDAGIEIPFPHRQLFVDEAKAFEDSHFMQPPANKR